MKRLKVVLALALALAMMISVSAAPALANNNRLDRQIRHDLRDDFGCFDCGLHDFNDCCDDFDFDDDAVVFFIPFGFNTFDGFGCWEWSWVFERWEWECD